MQVRTRLAVTAVVVSALGAGVGATAAGGSHERSDRFRAHLTGYEEVPAVSTRAWGSFHARLTGDGLRYLLRYRGIEGGDVQQAHIHFGQRFVNGGVSAFLCSNLESPPEGVPACPATGGTVRGTVEADDVVGPAAQGIDPGEFGELLRAMRGGVTYVNVHSDDFPAGEIRGQVKRRR